jgi:uncharacterized protein YegL
VKIVDSNYGGNNVINIKDDVQSGTKPMPIILLLDVSGSMGTAGKIDALNQAVVDMIDALKNEKETTYIVAAITFGENGQARTNLPYTKVQDIHWQPLGAHDNTPLGEALIIAKGMIEDKNITPSRSLRPAVVLISDGLPDSGWEKPFDAFVNDGRSQKCDRWAMGIGSGSEIDENMLRRFAKPGQTPDRFFKGDASKIHEFFQKVTMTVSTYAKKVSHGSSPFPVGSLGGASVGKNNDGDEIV